MGILSRPLWAILGLLALGLAISVAGALYFRGEARTLRVELNATKADLKGLESAVQALETQVRDRAVLDVRQSDVRAEKAKAVRAVRAEIQKEDANASDPHPVASAAQLDRLRRLTEAANAAVRAARVLP